MKREGRPALNVAVRRNGGSFKVFEKGVFVGNISGRKLVELVRSMRPSSLSAQVSAEQSGTKNGAFRPSSLDDVAEVLQ